MDRGSPSGPGADAQRRPAAGVADRADPEGLIRDALDLVGHFEPREYTGVHQGQKRALDAAMLRDAARARGIQALALSADTSLFGPATSGVVVHKNMGSTLLALDRSVTNNKHLTKRVLAAHGLPVARGCIVGTYSEALEAFAVMGAPVVTKPHTGSGGQGVTVGISTEAELEAACADILERERRIVIEEMVTAVDLRVMTIGARAVAATLRVPANITGDGQRTIGELVEQKNEIRSANPYLQHSPIELTASAEERLAAQGLATDSVLPDGERVFLHLTANISSGGDPHAITPLVHPDLLHLAERAAACFPSATHAGMDILAERLDVGLDAQRAIVCEVNLNNEIPMHILPMYGDPTDVHDLLIEPISESFSSRAGVLPGADTTPVPVDVDALEKIIAAAEPLREVAQPAGSDHGDGSAGPDHGDGSAGADHGDGSVPPEVIPGRDRDTLGLRPLLRAGGYDDIQHRGALVFATRGTQDVVQHRSGRSVVSDALSRRPEALYALADAVGIPTVRDAVDVPSRADAVDMPTLPDTVGMPALPDTVDVPSRADAVGDPTPGPREPAPAEPEGYTCDLLLIDGEPIATLLSTNGTDTVGLDGCPFPELLTYAAALRGPIGPTPILTIRCGLREQASSAQPIWALRGIDPDPVLAEFAYPGAGVAADVYPAAAAVLLNGESYVLPREHPAPAPRDPYAPRDL